MTAEERRLFAELLARVEVLEARVAAEDAEREAAERRAYRDSFREGRHPLDLRNADTDDLTHWMRQVDGATRGRRAA